MEYSFTSRVSMKYVITLLLLSISLITVAQPVVYQGFEVDSAAEPRGGMPLLNTFLQANLRKPVAAEAAGTGGRVILAGVVQPDGRMADVSVVKGIRPDLDREAIRVFSLYNAWKPAKKGGSAVRQAVTLPITFPRNEPFAYQNGAKARYFDADSKPVSDSTQARFKQVTPVDSAGLPAGDMVVYEKSGNKWRENNRLPLARNKEAYWSRTRGWIDELGCQNADRQWEGMVVGVDDQNRRVRESFYQNGKRVGDQFRYHDNGSVAEKNELTNGKKLITSWYPTGQIEQVKTSSSEPFTLQSTPDQVTALWDSAGVMLVDNGNGLSIRQDMVKSLQDTAVYTLFTEKGRYENGFKQGNWSGRYADGSFLYDETYDKGICRGGTATRKGAKPEPYDVLEQAPVFPGGMEGLGRFLSDNLRYPVTAQKAGIEGKVFISFVVCTDGTLCDYEVIKPVHPDVDKEALRVVKRMSGKWTPGVQRGKKVRVKYNLPINFSLY